MADVLTASRVQVSGIVQGVGFRPFIFKLAEEGRLCGHVANTSSGVQIHVEGAPERIEAFIRAIRVQAPPLAQITAVESRRAAPATLADLKLFPAGMKPAVRP